MTQSEIKFHVVKQRINASSRRLSANWAFEVPESMSTMFRKSKREAKEKLRSFVRVYNRKKIYYPKDFEDAGYPSYTLPDVEMTQSKNIINWCKEQFGANNYVFFGYTGTFYFLTEQDKVMFLLRWSGQ
jgi:hypothetical protein